MWTFIRIEKSYKVILLLKSLFTCCLRVLLWYSSVESNAHFLWNFRSPMVWGRFYAVTDGLAVIPHVSLHSYIEKLQSNFGTQITFYLFPKCVTMIFKCWKNAHFVWNFGSPIVRGRFFAATGGFAWRLAVTSGWASIRMKKSYKVILGTQITFYLLPTGFTMIFKFWK